MPNPWVKIGRFINLPLHFLLILLVCLFFIIVGAFSSAVPLFQIGYRPVAPYSLNLNELYRVNVNTADLSALCAVPGIGEKKAKAIIEYRQTSGAFHSIDELEKVKGISKKSIENWREYLYAA